MPEQYDNSGTLWKCKEGAKCHSSGDAIVDGKTYKLFCNADGDNRLVDFVSEGSVPCILKPIKERKNDKMPHYRGEVCLDGEDLEVAGWAKLVTIGSGPRKGEERKILSLKIKKKEQQRQQQQQEPEGDDQDIPF